MSEIVDRSLQKIAKCTGIIFIGIIGMLPIPKTRAELQHHLRDPLYKSSYFIMLTSISNAGFGFLFWILAARLYPKEDVGVATALISSMALLVLLSRFGLDQSIIRFFPERDKGVGRHGYHPL